MPRTNTYFTTVDAVTQTCDATRLLELSKCLDGDGKPRGKDSLDLYVLQFDGIATLAWLCKQHRDMAAMLKGCTVRPPTRQDIECLVPPKREPVRAQQAEMFPEVPYVRKTGAGRVHA